MQDAADAELLRMIAAGEDPKRAESELCRRFAPRIRLYGLRHLRSEDGARDLVQTVLVAVLAAARAARVEDPSRLDRFVLGTCRNTASKMRAGAARTEPLPDDVDLAALAAEPAAPVDKLALSRCLARLEPRQLRVVFLSFAEDRRPDEIAAALATTTGNVRVLRHRAVEALRRCMHATPEATP